MSRIACIAIPNLPIALARRDDPALAARPLVLYRAEGRTVVYAASEDSGIVPGTPLRQACLRCPQAIYALAEPARDNAALAQLTALLGAFSPRVAALAPLPDPAFALDLGKPGPAQERALAARLLAQLRAALGLVPALGIASTRLVAQHAARRAGAGIAVQVEDGGEADFLAPEPIAALDLDAELATRLARLGLRTLGDLARIPVDALQAQFGTEGAHLAQLARGLDATPIAATPDTPTLERRWRFASPLLDRSLLEQAITTLAARLTGQLVAGAWSASVLALRLELDEGAPLETTRMLAEPTSDPAQICQALLALCRQAEPGSGVTAVSVRAAGLAPLVAAQLELFAPVGVQSAQLRGALDRLGGRFAGALLRAELAEPAAALPEQRVRLRPR